MFDSRHADFGYSFVNRPMKIQCLTYGLVIGMFAAAPLAGSSRHVICLNGQWDVAEGDDTTVPSHFNSTVPVPGLLDMASPTFQEVGSKNSDAHRQSFWYRTTFKLDGEVPASAVLKLHKVQYGYDVYMNGQPVGSHRYNFTPATFNVRDTLQGHGADNVLVVRVGGLPTHPKASDITGEDGEKFLNIPGIYDNVELILTGSQMVENVQIAPDVTQQQIRVKTWVRSSCNKSAGGPIRFVIREAANGKIVSETELKSTSPQDECDGCSVNTFILDIPNPNLWSPEDPFLYTLEAHTADDMMSARFGMREFRFDPVTKKPMLNNKIYYLRGTNICIYRFFEDPDRGGKPWDRDWVRRVIRAFKSMNWNCCRYCIGFPPEIWYETADEEGLLIQDEFPFWLPPGIPESITTDEVIPEFTDWMKSRWNHPCVAIWDAQNETRGLGKLTAAIQAVRGLDMSNRPWDCGWDPPVLATDTHEDHAYPFINMPDEKKASAFRISQFSTLKPPGPHGVHTYGQNAFNGDCDNPLIVNEYGWWWLNRDGSPTRLTIKNYKEFLGEDSTAEQRRELYARCLALLTEFYRSGRGCAGVMHFCGLTHSLPPKGETLEKIFEIDLPGRNFYGLQGERVGATCDNFIELEGPTFEPHFKKYVGDAFAPTGIMLAVWEPKIQCGAAFEAPVVIVNDRYEPWEGVIHVKILQGDAIISETKQSVAVEPLGRVERTFTLHAPDRIGVYDAVAQLVRPGEETVSSWRNFTVIQ
jgi:beta-galactosidase